MPDMTVSEHLLNSETGNLVVAIHQPNFIPWAGFFHKMLVSNLFIYLDTAPFTKNGFQNRNRIWTPNGIQWLTVPILTKGSFNAASREIKINNQITWKKKHLASIKLNYKNTDNFQWVFDSIEPVYSADSEFLLDFNIAILQSIRSLLSINTPVRLASEFPSEDMSTERLIYLTQRVGGKIYLSGVGGKKYIDEDSFSRSGIQLDYHHYQGHPLFQRDGTDSSNLSILHLLFVCGRETRKWIMEGTSER